MDATSSTGAPGGPSASAPGSTPADDLLGVLVADAHLDHETRLRLGRHLLAAERSARASEDGWTLFGVTSFHQLCEQRLNLSSAAGWQMRRAAEACEGSDDLRQRVEDGRLSVAKAASISRVLDYVQRTGQERALLDLAQHATTHATRAEVSRLLEEARTQQSLVRIDVFLTRTGLANLRRTRDLLTDGRGGLRPTESHAVETALGFYVDRHCPERRAARAMAPERRDGPTEPPASKSAEPSDIDRTHSGPAPDPGVSGASPSQTDPRDRRIRARDQHEVVRRHGDRCWVADCEERGALQFAHGVPARRGGSSRFWNLARWCLHHHRGFDSGTLMLRPGRGSAVIVDRRGQVVGRVREEPPP